MTIDQTKKSLKTFLTIGVLAAAAFGVSYGGKYAYTVYVGAGAGDEPKQVKAQVNNESSATISWQTEKESYGFVDYGSTEMLGLSAMDKNGEKVTSHNVELKNLLPNTKYYFKVGSGEEAYGQDGTPQGKPFSFVTEVQGNSKQTTDSEPATEKGNKAEVQNQGEVTKEGFEMYFYTNNSQYDINKDGEVNSLDYDIWQKGQ